nr:MAG: replication initiation protein [Microvirus sp.]
MQCTSPQNYNGNGIYMHHVPPCNNCLACLLNRQHQWAARLTLEGMTHSKAQFITLTYDNDNLTVDHNQLKRDFQLFIKRYSKRTGTQPRYYACLEFGNRFNRPHWHAIFFGADTKLQRRTPKRSDNKNLIIYVDPNIEDTWQNGSTYVKACDQSNLMMSITQYVAGYILKGKWNDKGATKGERALMSRTPYIGQPAVTLLSEKYLTAKGARRLAKLGTIPNYFYHSDRRYQMPPRIRKDVAAYLGYPLLAIDNEKTQNQNTATSLSNKIAKSIRHRRRINVTTQTG